MAGSRRQLQPSQAAPQDENPPNRVGIPNGFGSWSLRPEGPIHLRRAPPHAFSTRSMTKGC